ncbi:hypothetical protein GCM10009799_08710 [Nocardiopsis rhodophaea]|uniref:Uncharacterized protein n=1 Tax=Nocardiopsis rhodophaea TaxID=280238 RepID=A0ABN2SFF6_9ACTN
MHVCTLRAQLRRPVKLLVLCPDERTAAWACTPIEIEDDPNGMVLRPWALGPNHIPVVEDWEQARSSPELAVLSASAHGDNEAVLKAVQYALDTVPEDRSLIYNDYIVSKLSSAAQKTWEALMATGTYEWQTDFARKHIAEGEAEAIILFLEARGLKVEAEQQKRIRECTDLDLLSEWVRRAATVREVEELFA